MRKGILVRRSRAADLCHLFGGLALPVLVLGALGSRLGAVPSQALMSVLVLGFALGLLSISFGGYAIVDIWNSGAQGARSAAAGLLFASPVAAILIAVAAAAIAYPKLSDVSTDLVEPPAAGDADPAAPPPVDVEAAAIQADALPDIAPRLYPQPIAKVYAAAQKIVRDREWRVTVDVPPPSMPASLKSSESERDSEADDVLDAKATVTQSRAQAVGPGGSGGVSVDSAPVPAAESGILKAVARTPVFGFSDDVGIRLRETPDGTRVDMRSASRIGMHDLGENVRRIRGFLAELDLALQPDPNAAPAAVPVAAAPNADSAASVSQ